MTGNVSEPPYSSEHELLNNTSDHVDSVLRDCVAPSHCFVNLEESCLDGHCVGVSLACVSNSKESVR